MIYRQFNVTLDPKEFRADVLANTERYTVNKKYSVLAMEAREGTYDVIIVGNDDKIVPMPINRVKFAGFVDDNEQLNAPIADAVIKAAVPANGVKKKVGAK